MNLTAKELQKRAQRKQRALARKRRDARFRAVMGRLLAAGHLRTNMDGIEAHRDPVELEDALWAGAVEPRILELLPALVLKTPALFVSVDPMPDDLHRCVWSIRQGRATEPFRGIPPKDYLQWVTRLGHKGKAPTLSKTFRFQQEDLLRLRQLADSLRTTETDVIRRALRALERVDGAH